MPKFAANLSMLYTELPFLERFKAASENGFQYIEYLFPYEWSPHVLATHLKQHDLQQVLFNLPPGNWDQGERGIACLPDRINEFRKGVDKAIEYANILDVNQLNCLAGLRPENYEYAEIWQTFTNNITYAAQRLNEHDITLLIEPINSKIDMPGFFIDTLDKALQTINEIKLSNVKVQFDIYHMQIMQGDILRSLGSNLQYIQHIQFADCPGRNEPGTGELNFQNIFKYLDRIQYSGWVSAEYIPKSETQGSLNWFQQRA
jgi:hydroxypyruvate isomerase